MGLDGRKDFMLKTLISLLSKLLRSRKVGQEKPEQKIIVVGDIIIVNNK